MKSKWILAGLILALGVLVGCGGGGGDDPYTPPPVPQGPWTVSFETNGGEAIPSQTVPNNGKVTPVKPVKEGSAFLGWYRDVNLYIEWNFETNTVTKNMTLYADWYEIPNGYFKVSFFTDGGSLVIDQVIIEGGTVEEPAVPTKDHFLFSAWYKDSDFTELWDFAADVVSSSTTLYAEWIPALTVTFNSNGGEPVQKQLILAGEKAQSVTPERNGYRFLGWYTEAAFTDKWNFDTVVTEDITLYAKWELKAPVTITFVSNTPGIDIPVLNTFVGEKIKRPRQALIRGDGKACVGWFRDNTTFANEWDFLTMEVRESMILYADWGTAANVWLSSNHDDGDYFLGTLNQQWDDAARAEDERRFFQRKDGTHYMELSCADTKNYYFRFSVQGTFGGNALNGRLQPSTNDLQVIYNDPMSTNYLASSASGTNSWQFASDGDFSIILDARDSSNRFFILTQPYTITDVSISPSSYVRDSGTAFTRQFTATVNGKNPPSAVTWELEGATGGTSISQTGLVSVTAAETPKTMTIRVTSKTAPDISGTATLVLQTPSGFPVVTDVIVTPLKATIMKAALTNGNIQTHGSFPAQQYRGQQFTASAVASGGATENVTWSIVETVKSGTRVTAAGYVTVALNEERESFTLRVSSAEPGFENVYVDVPITVQSFSVWVVGAATDPQWGRGGANLMNDNGDGTYTWTGELINSPDNLTEGLAFNTNKVTGGVGGTIAWSGDAWYNFSQTTNATRNVFGVGTFTLRAAAGQANMFRVNDTDLGKPYTIVLDVIGPSVTVTEGP